MNYQTRSIRTFIGCKNYNESRAFYSKLGFREIQVGEKMCYFEINKDKGFYLQDYYVKDWVENSMVFLELDNLDECHESITAKRLQDQYR